MLDERFAKQSLGVQPAVGGGADQRVESGLQLGSSRCCRTLTSRLNRSAAKCTSTCAGWSCSKGTPVRMRAANCSRGSGNGWACAGRADVRLWRMSCSWRSRTSPSSGAGPSSGPPGGGRGAAEALLMPPCSPMLGCEDSRAGRARSRVQAGCANGCRYPRQGRRSERARLRASRRQPRPRAAQPQASPTPVTTRCPRHPRARPSARQSRRPRPGPPTASKPCAGHRPASDASAAPAARAGRG